MPFSRATMSTKVTSDMVGIYRSGALISAEGDACAWAGCAQRKTHVISRMAKKGAPKRRVREHLRPSNRH